MAILRFKNVEDAPADGQAVQLVHIDGLEAGGGTAPVTAVEVETLEAGQDATASLEGSTLKLGIPRGEKGETGAQGPKGDAGAAGTAGPKGDKGDTGAAGAAGAAGLGVSAIALTTDESGKVTGGKWTDTKSAQHDISVTSAGA